MTYRLLKSDEINLLLSQGCSADSWTDISVKDKFSAENIRNTRFEGKITLGLFSGTLEGEKGFIKKCGIFNSNIRHCEIADNVYISDVKNLTNS